VVGCDYCRVAHLDGLNFFCDGGRVPPTSVGDGLFSDSSRCVSRYHSSPGSSFFVSSAGIVSEDKEKQNAKHLARGRHSAVLDRHALNRVCNGRGLLPRTRICHAQRFVESDYFPHREYGSGRVLFHASQIKSDCWSRLTASN